MPPASQAAGISQDPLSHARTLFRVPVSYRDHSRYHDPAEHEAILLGPDMSSESTKHPARARAVTSEYTGAIPLPQVPLLTAEQEEGLFLRYNFLRLKQHNLQQSFRGATPPDADLIGFESLATAAEADRRTIFEANTRLIVSVAKRYVRPQHPLEDLVSEGVPVLFRLIDRFEVNRGFKFSTYATGALKKEFWGYLQKEQQLSTRYTQTDVPETIEATAHEQSLDDKEGEPVLKEMLRSIIANRLKEREQRIVWERLGLGEGEGMTLRELGDVLELSRERVRQLESGTIVKLREILSRTPELAGVLPEDILEDWHSARESTEKRDAKILCVSLLLKSPLKTKGPVTLGKLIDWIDSRDNNEAFVRLLPSVLGDLVRRGAVVATRTDSGVRYALTQPALVHVRSINQRLSESNVKATLDFLDSLILSD
jgi:RNA polymerase primary sigma factor